MVGPLELALQAIPPASILLPLLGPSKQMLWPHGQVGSFFLVVILGTLWASGCVSLAHSVWWGAGGGLGHWRLELEVLPALSVLTVL